MRFHNRRQAGRELAERLLERMGGDDLAQAVVLALPRGGVPIAAEVARALRVSLDVLVVRTIGVPGAPEVGIGAIADDEPPLFDSVGLAAMHLDEHKLGSEIAGERAALYRSEGFYRAGRPAPHVAGRTVVLVDDGSSVGITARAALRHLRRQGPAYLVLAVPVCSRDTARALRGDVDALVCLDQPAHRMPMGEHYAEFEQITDQEIQEALRQPHPA
ncbi:phosphoribosyltransferase family protein [Streptomyces sp. NPDC093228]|uniref:phosphoribosyltransferase n=1 Tax=unclassified Streptomyces TaxID=2593676 RepID=UPI000740EE52|nr:MULTISPECIES: phosphoribosyltransferase family protein [unclassified Streptomyces]KUJ58128.1 phosphoribosyltransferase [Streptomyces sp. NRRL F-5122]MDX3258320.1 phosphoribosyltransferase family protein [Streptomyces sp. MI02-2A]